MLLYINLERYQFDSLFCDISNRKTFLRVKLKLLEYLQLWIGNKKVVAPYVCIDFENLHRAFLVNPNGNKVISFTFDFTIKTASPDYSAANQITSIHYHSTYGRIEPRNISEAQSILTEYEQNSNSLYNNLSLDDEDNIAPESYRLFEFMLFREDGYIRYDYDEKGYKPLIHPVNHFDVNYSDPSHYKLGLHKKANLQEFMTFLDKKKVCATIELDPSSKSKQLSGNKRKQRKRRR